MRWFFEFILMLPSSWEEFQKSQPSNSVKKQRKKRIRYRSKIIEHLLPSAFREMFANKPRKTKKQKGPSKKREKSFSQEGNFIGLDAELESADFLKSKGFTIIKQQYQAVNGEIDIIAAQENLLIIVEVKYSANGGKIITSSQKVRIKRIAQYFLETHPEYQKYRVRFDIIIVTPHGCNHKEGSL